MPQQYLIKMQVVNGNMIDLLYNLPKTTLTELESEIKAAQKFTGIQKIEVFLLDDETMKKFLMHEWEQTEKECQCPESPDCRSSSSRTGASSSAISPVPKDDSTPKASATFMSFSRRTKPSG